MGVIFLLKVFKCEYKFRKCKKKNQKKQKIFFVSEINGSENVAEIVSIKKKKLAIGSQWVEKQS